MSKISVIVPIYNVEKYLPICIESIINQTYKNLEIILVNDGSTDNCRKICDKYARKDNRIKVIHKENGGLSDARNVGMEYATGDYIYFIDSDDYIDIKTIEILYKNLKKYNADISMSRFIRTNNNNFRSDLSNEKIKLYSNVESLNMLYNKEFTFHENYALFICAWNKLYKKELLEGIQYPIGKLYEDGATTYKILYKASLIVCSSLQLYYYYQREESISRKKFDETRFHRMDAFKGQMNFYKEKNLKQIYYNCLNTYLNMIIEYYYLADKHPNCEKIRKYLRREFNKELKQAKKNVKFPEERIYILKEFQYPKYYSYKSKLKEEGFFNIMKRKIKNI